MSEDKKLRQKNFALLLLLFGLAALLFSLTLVKFGHFTGAAGQ